MPEPTRESLPAPFEAAWNAHDMEAFGRLFHTDASFVNGFGTYWREIEPIIAGHTFMRAKTACDGSRPWKM